MRRDPSSQHPDEFSKGGEEIPPPVKCGGKKEEAHWSWPEWEVSKAPLAAGLQKARKHDLTEHPAKDSDDI